jgi:hypothetical protein
MKKTLGWALIDVARILYMFADLFADAADLVDDAAGSLIDASLVPLAYLLVPLVYLCGAANNVFHDAGSECIERIKDCGFIVDRID